MRSLRGNVDNVDETISKKKKNLNIKARAVMERKTLTKKGPK